MSSDNSHAPSPVGIARRPLTWHQRRALARARMHHATCSNSNSFRTHSSSSSSAIASFALFLVFFLKVSPTLPFELFGVGGAGVFRPEASPLLRELSLGLSFELFSSLRLDGIERTVGGRESGFLPKWFFLSVARSAAPSSLAGFCFTGDWTAASLFVIVNRGGGAAYGVFTIC